MYIYVCGLSRKPPQEQQYLQELGVRPGASRCELARLCELSAISFPEDYLAFLQETNGAEGMLGSSYVVFWRTEDLLEYQQGGAIAQFFPGIFLIGSDGGGEAFGIDLRGPVPAYIRIPFITIDDRDLIVCAHSLEEFLHYLYNLDWKDW